MKKRILVLFILVLFVFTPVLGQAKKWVTTNKVTVACTDDQVHPNGFTVKYRWFFKELGAEKTEKGENRKNADGSIQFTFKLALGTVGYAGVQVVYYVDTELVTFSEIAWSDAPAATDDNPFGLVYVILKRPTLLRPE